MDTAQIVDSVVSSFIDKHLKKPAVPEPFRQAPGQSVAKGILAGVVAGVVATAAKSVAEKIYPPRTHGEPEPPAVLADKVAGHELARGSQGSCRGSDPLGLRHRRRRRLRSARRVLPGRELSRRRQLRHDPDGAHARDGAARDGPLGSRPPHRPAGRKTSEIATHVVFGLVTETVRKLVRKML